MNKKRFSVFMAVIGCLLFTSCLKEAKDTLEDLDQRTQCVELLFEFTTDGGDKTCSQQIKDIDKILKDCNEFLTQEQKDELNTTKENCSDN